MLAYAFKLTRSRNLSMVTRKLLNRKLFEFSAVPGNTIRPPPPEGHGSDLVASEDLDEAESSPGSTILKFT